MIKIEKKDIWLFIAQAGVWTVILFALPLATFLSTRDWESTHTSLVLVWQLLRGPLVLYFANFYVFVFLLLNLVMAAIAVGVRHFIRIRQIKQQLKDEKAKSTEAELAWLKSQINPHFLFNTLNNISSLTQIDPDAVQDAIAQLEVCHRMMQTFALGDT